MAFGHNPERNCLNVNSSQMKILISNISKLIL